MKNSPFDFQPVLENKLLKIRPIEESDFEALYSVASDPEIWEQHPSKERSTLEGFKHFFEVALLAKTAFVIIDKKNNQIIGSSRYTLSHQVANAIEIGFTFLSKKYWGKGYNASFKHLLMAHAFNHFDYVLFYVGATNFRSQNAVEKLGGNRIFELEGVSLKEKPTAQAIFCITKNEFERLK